MDENLGDSNEEGCGQWFEAEVSSFALAVDEAGSRSGRKPGVRSSDGVPCSQVSICGMKPLG